MRNYYPHINDENFTVDDVSFKRATLEKILVTQENRIVDEKIIPFDIYTFTFNDSKKIKNFTYAEDDPMLYKLLNLLDKNLENSLGYIEKDNDKFMISLEKKLNVKRTVIRALISFGCGIITLIGLNSFFSLPNTIPADVINLINTLSVFGVSLTSYFGASGIKPKPNQAEQTKLDNLSKKHDDYLTKKKMVTNILRTKFGKVSSEKFSSLKSEQSVNFYDFEDEYVQRR